jgi:RNA polymerase sigma-70 factor (ECF subfamily)
MQVENGITAFLGSRGSCSSKSVAMNCDLDRWFATEILPHEAALMGYLRRICSRAADVPDLRQDTYIRVYESARTARPRFPKSFLFTTARNLMVDRIRRERIVSMDYTQDLDSLSASLDELSPERRLSARQELSRLSDAFDRLPEKTRAAIWLRRVEGFSQREAARSLGMNEGALESHMSRGLRAMANAVLGQATSNEIRDGDFAINQEREHGQSND